MSPAWLASFSGPDPRRSVWPLAAGFRRGLVAALVLASASACWALTQTTTTTYQYNVDGALTAVTTQIGAQASSTMYVTWDDFVPAAGNPTTGTVLSGNGNLLGFGPMPGSAFTTQFQYDPRNRLTAATASGAPGTTYTYYPASLMASSTLAGGDALQFYYDASPLSEVANIMQPSTATWSSYLPDVSYLSDGIEQVRCQPRKDVAGLYEASQQSFSPLRYDPYGSLASGADVPATNGATYDMGQNPFRYGDEYQDPAWGGYYLRERWYLPALQTFLGRDPFDAVHRYGYAGGNPTVRTDPSGRSYESFSRAVNHFLRPVSKGILGDTLPLIPIYGQVVGGLQLVANAPQFWNHPTERTWMNYGFLLASVAVEVGDAVPRFDLWAGGAVAFRSRVGADIGIGIGQTVLAGHRANGKWDVGAMVQSAELGFSNIVSARYVEGFGYRPYSLSANDVAQTATTYFQNNPASDQMLVFRVYRDEAHPLYRGTSPLREWRTMGGYHESVVAVARDWSLSTEVVARDAGSFIRAGVETRWNIRTDDSPTPYMRNKQMMLVGTYSRADVEQAFGVEQLASDPQSHYNQSDMGTHRRPNYPYNFFRNNCHDYAQQVLSGLQ